MLVFKIKYRHVVEDLIYYRLIKKVNYRILRLDIGSELVQNISNKMMLVYSGISRISSEVQEKNQKIDPIKRIKSLEKIAKISDQVTEEILNENICFNVFSDYLEETWENKIKLFPDSENTTRILKIYSEAKRFGAKSGKLLGAGGGGFFYF